MTDMQVAVWLGRKSGHDFGMFSGFNIVMKYLTDEIPWRSFAHSRSDRVHRALRAVPGRSGAW
jgi:hypothetical protein